MQDVAFQSLLKNEDYITVAQNGNGGKFKEIKYKLSISCLEYFIARKVRPVFDVYRQVFHKATEQKPLSQIDILVQSALQLKEQEQRLSMVEDKVKHIEAATKTRPDYYTIVGYGTLNGMKINLRQASQLGRKASELCKKKGFDTDTTPDPRFGTVKMYPKEILEEVFLQPVN